MLHVPQLDDMNYSSMFERARRMIPRINAEWTDLNHHDPGITTLQMFYWLIDSLNYYLDATGEQHRLKYLKLLGISSLATPARCFVAVDGNAIHLPHGTKLYADDTVFETVAPFDAANNELVALYNAVNDTKKDMTRFAGVDGSFAEIFTTSVVFTLVSKKNSARTRRFTLRWHRLGATRLATSFRLQSAPGSTMTAKTSCLAPSYRMKLAVFYAQALCILI